MDYFQDSARITIETIRKATKGIQDARESLKRKKQRYDKKKRALEMWRCLRVLMCRRAMEISDRERKMDEMVNKISYLEREVVRHSLLFEA